MPFWTKFWLVAPALALLATATFLYRSRRFRGFEDEDEGAGS